MRVVHQLIFSVASVLLLSTSFAACGGDDGGGDEEPFDTFQACFDDHHIEEAFDVHDSIEICCIDHPIGGQDANVVCGESADACEAFVTDNLVAADASPDDVSSACADYVVDRAE